MPIHVRAEPGDYAEACRLTDIVRKLSDRDRPPTAATLEQNLNDLTG